MSLRSYLWGWREMGIRKGDLVLEVGSGGRPLARSDVLCDMFIEDDSERAKLKNWQSLLADRPFVCADAQNLPFKTQSFDFFVSVHTLEHIIWPERFLNEAMRVAKRGYIVTPSRFCELIIPQHIHLWLVDIDYDGTLVCTQKTSVSERGIPGHLHKAWLEDGLFRRWYQSRRDLFETRYSWVGNIRYRVDRYEEVPSWLVQSKTVGTDRATVTVHPTRTSLPRWARMVSSRGLRKLFSPSFSLEDILACPTCQASLRIGRQFLECENCRCSYPVRGDGIPILVAEMAQPFSCETYAP